VNLQPVHHVGVSVNIIRVTYVTGVLWWTCTRIWDVRNTTICGQAGHEAPNF